MFTSQAAGAGKRGFDPNAFVRNTRRYVTPREQIEWWCGDKGHCRGLNGELLVSGVALHLMYGEELGDGSGDYMAFDSRLRLKVQAQTCEELREIASGSWEHPFVGRCNQLGLHRLWYLGRIDHLHNGGWQMWHHKSLTDFVADCVRTIPFGETIVIDDAHNFTPDSLGWDIVLCLRRQGYKVGCEPTASKGSVWTVAGESPQWITSPLWDSNTEPWKHEGREYVQCYRWFNKDTQKWHEGESEAFVRKVLSKGDVPMLGPSWFANKSNKELAASIIAQGSK
jgi:hypothetical protein